MDPSSAISLNTGTAMPLTGFGTWSLKGDDAVRAVTEALKQGYRLIDTAASYGNQREVGQGIKQCGFNRQEIFVVTKILPDQDAYSATAKCLKELGLSYADLVLIHTPPADGVGVELWEGLIRARDDGLVKDIGLSNYSCEQMDELIYATDEVPVVNQIEWSPFGHSMGMLDWAEENEVVIQAYSTLTRAEKLDDETILQLAEKYNKTPAQIIIRWNIQHHVVPLVKASTQEHMQENLDVFDFDISPEDMGRLDSLNEQYSVIAPKPLYI